MGNNGIQFIAADEFVDLRRIHSLRLDGNQLPVVLEKTFINQVELRILCLARNKLAKITNTAFLNLSNLYELDISYNKLNRVEGVVFHPLAESLRKLVLSGNYLSTEILTAILQTTIKLHRLDVADMDISDLPYGIFHDQLKALNLSGNNLTSLRVHVLPPQLVELDISRNKFRGLNERVLLRFEHLQDLRLQRNPWSCDLCHIQPMFLRLNKSDVYQNTTCASPPRLKGLTLKYLKKSDIKDCMNEEDLGKQNLFMFFQNHLSILIGSICLFLFLVACITFVVYSCLQRRVNIVVQEEKRNSEREAVFENPTAIFGDKDEISFKFSLDLTERKVSISTIDEIKRDTQLHTLPNGTGIGI